MFNHFLELFKTKNPPKIYTKEYISAYNKLWIKDIADYIP